MNNNLPNYLDNASTTKDDQRVLEAMLPYCTEIYGNASSSHTFSKMTIKAIEKSRNQVATLFNSTDSEIIFTAAATDSINLVLKEILDHVLGFITELTEFKSYIYEHRKILSEE